MYLLLECWYDYRLDVLRSLMLPCFKCKLFYDYCYDLFKVRSDAETCLHFFFFKYEDGSCGFCKFASQNKQTLK